MRATEKERKKERNSLTDTGFFDRFSKNFRISAKFSRKVVTDSERWNPELVNQQKKEMIWVN
jgi:hypothetical protein